MSGVTTKALSDLKGGDILLVEQITPLRSIGIFYAVGIELLHLSANNLHGTVHHTVLLRKRIRKHSHCGRQPPFREHPLMKSAFPVLIYFRLNLVEHKHLTFSAVRIRTGITGIGSQSLLIRHNQNNRIRVLIVMQHHLVNIYGAVRQRILKPLRTVFFAVEKVIVFDELDEYKDKEISINEIQALGDELLREDGEAFAERYKSVGPDDYANISYTSGTTADPKGILLTHRNYTANVEQAHSIIGVDVDDVMLIILPLDHCFAHVAGFYTMMSYGASIATVPVGKTPMATLKNIPIAIKEVRPMVMLSVPALARNFKKNIESGIKAKGAFVENIPDFAELSGRHHYIFCIGMSDPEKQVVAFFKFN